MIEIFKHANSVNELVKGRAFLHYACDYGQKDIIEYLLSKGADINVIFIFYSNDSACI
jgi:hypothetical protein